MTTSETIEELLEEYSLDQVLDVYDDEEILEYITDRNVSIGILKKFELFTLIDVLKFEHIVKAFKKYSLAELENMLPI